MRPIFALLFFVFIPFSAQAQITSFSTWENTRGSTLSVWFVDSTTGAFTGTYVNNAVGFDCKGAPYEVAGVTKGTAVTFAVNWKGFGVPDCKSTTVWKGQAIAAAMKTRWVLDYIGQDGQPHRMYGTDIFTKR